MWTYLSKKPKDNKDDKDDECVCNICQDDNKISNMYEMINSQNEILVNISQKLIDNDKMITEILVKINQIMQMLYDNKVAITEIKKIINNQAINYY